MHTLSDGKDRKTSRDLHFLFTFCVVSLQPAPFCDFFIHIIFHPFSTIRSVLRYASLGRAAIDSLFRSCGRSSDIFISIDPPRMFDQEFNAACPRFGARCHSSLILIIE